MKPVVPTTACTPCSAHQRGVGAGGVEHGEVDGHLRRRRRPWHRASAATSTPEDAAPGARTGRRRPPARARVGRDGGAHRRRPSCRPPRTPRPGSCHASLMAPTVAGPPRRDARRSRQTGRDALRRELPQRRDPRPSSSSWPGDAEAAGWDGCSSGTTCSSTASRSLDVARPVGAARAPIAHATPSVRARRARDPGGPAPAVEAGQGGRHPRSPDGRAGRRRRRARLAGRRRVRRLRRPGRRPRRADVFDEGLVVLDALLRGGPVDATQRHRRYTVDAEFRPAARAAAAAPDLGGRR